MKTEQKWTRLKNETIIIVIIVLFNTEKTVKLQLLLQYACTIDKYEYDIKIVKVNKI